MSLNATDVNEWLLMASVRFIPLSLVYHILNNQKLFDWLLLYNVWHSNIETRSISIYELEKFGQERERREPNKWHAINIQQENQTFTEQLKQEHDNPSCRVNENTPVGKRTVLICDDERDLLFMFRITLQESYDVLTAKSGEECIKIYLKAIFRKKDWLNTFRL